jgi:hypothetical protein
MHFGQGSQLFGLAAKHSPLKPVLTINFHVGHDYSQHLLVHIDCRYSCDIERLSQPKGKRVNC